MKRVPVVMGCAAQGITDRVAQSMGTEVDLSVGDADVNPRHCSGNRMYYLKCTKSRLHASEL